MKHLKKFLARLQTFELSLIHRKVAEGPLGHRERTSYDIRHETHYDEAAVFESEFRLLSQLAALDLLPLHRPQLQLVLEQITGIEDRFRSFWVNFHNHALDYGQPYPYGYLHKINLPDLFVLHNLQPIEANIEVREELVDDLAESVKLREALLASLLRHVQALLPAKEEQELPSAEPVSIRTVSGSPRFVDGVTEKLIEILKGYFTPDDQQQLLPLLQENHSPASPLLFHGNGNQLADAFKQLYEANLLVGCLKGELEAWIAAHFAYVFRKQQRTLPPITWPPSSPPMPSPASPLSWTCGNNRTELMLFTRCSARRKTIPSSRKQAGNRTAFLQPIQTSPYHCSTNHTKRCHGTLHLRATAPRHQPAA